MPLPCFACVLSKTSTPLLGLECWHSSRGRRPTAQRLRKLYLSFSFVGVFASSTKPARNTQQRPPNGLEDQQGQKKKRLVCYLLLFATTGSLPIHGKKRNVLSSLIPKGEKNFPFKTKDEIQKQVPSFKTIFAK